MNNMNENRSFDKELSVGWPGTEKILFFKLSPIENWHYDLFLAFVF